MRKITRIVLAATIALHRPFAVAHNSGPLPEAMAIQDGARCEQTLLGRLRGSWSAAVSKTKDRIDHCSPWCFSPRLEDEFLDVFRRAGTENDQQRLQELAEKIIAERVKQLPKVSQFFLRKVLADDGRSSFYAKSLGGIVAKAMGPHYMPIVNRVAIPQSAVGISAQPIVMAHEIQHAMDRNTNPLVFLALVLVYPKEFFMIFRTPFTPALRRHAETRAIGMQWEIARRIPTARRAEMIRHLENTGMDPFGSWYMEDEINARLLILPGPIQRLFSDLVKYAVALEIKTSEQTEEWVYNQLFVPQIEREEKFQRVLKPVLLLQDSDDRTVKELLTMGLGGYVEQPDAILASETDPQDYSPELYKRLKIFATKLRYSGSLQDCRQLLMTKVLLETLRHAHLSKQEFIEEVSKAHGYDWENLLRKHRRHWLLGILTADTLLTFWLFDFSFGQTSANLMANDMKLLFKVLDLLFG